MKGTLWWRTFTEAIMHVSDLFKTAVVAHFYFSVVAHFYFSDHAF